MKTTLSLILGGLSLVSASKIDSFNSEAMSENTAFIESEFGEELRNNNGTNLESSKFYLRQKNEDPFDGTVNYGLFEGKPTSDAKDLLRFTPPTGTTVDELIKMTCYTEEDADKDFDLEAFYTDSESVYIEFGDVLYCTNNDETVFNLTKADNLLTLASTTAVTPSAVSNSEPEEEWENQEEETQAYDDYQEEPQQNEETQAYDDNYQEEPQQNGETQAYDDNYQEESQQEEETEASTNNWQDEEPKVETEVEDNSWMNEQQDMASEAANVGGRFSDTDEYLRYTGWALSAVGAGLLGYAVIEHMTASDIDSKATDWEAIQDPDYILDGEALLVYFNGDEERVTQIRANAASYAESIRAKQADHESTRNLVGGAGILIGGAGLYMSFSF
jgi:hypothetical protein